MSSFQLGDQMPNFSLPTYRAYTLILEEHQSWHFLKNNWTTPFSLKHDYWASAASQ
ncbi:hypothetical protein WAX46_05310 [Bacillus sp. FJAT-53060]|uniref:hypothetical protein n=1 Tax=Bacillus TaxID=1386 RepID=UPI001CFB1C2C|nr:hypothetical protein [Bacillus stratosphericus]